MTIAQAKSSTQIISENAHIRSPAQNCKQFAKTKKIRIARKPVGPASMREIAPAFVGIAG